MKKILSLLTLLLCIASGAWAASYYTPTEDEVIILNEVYSATGTNYSTHTAVAWAGTASTSNKKAGDPNNDGAATSSNVPCYSIKGNGKGKNITLFISGVSKLTLYHESHSSRYPELRITPDGGSLTTEKGASNTYFTEVNLDGTKSYSIFLHGTTGTDDQDLYVYAVKLKKYVNKAISSETLAGVKFNNTSLTVNSAENGYVIEGTTITLSTDLVSYVSPTVTLTNHIVYTDETSDDTNVDVTFDGTVTENYWIGTATIGQTEYTVKVPYGLQEITAVKMNGIAISDEDLATLKTTKSVSIDGSSVNGVGFIAVELTGGTTTVNRQFSGNDVVYTFTVSTDNYTVRFTNINKTYSAIGDIVYYSKDGTNVEGANTKEVTANGITFTMVADKTFQYGSSKVTIDGAEYVPLKLSTGSAVNVTFPAGKVATKVKVYGWSQDGNGKLYCIKETSDDAAKTVGDLSSDIFYAKNTSDDKYPSVYEYELDDWTSLYFNAGGSPSQPFVIMEFIFNDTKTPAPTITVGDFSFASKGYPVTITSENTLYVSTDGVNYTEQTSPYETEATSTTTFYAKATATGLEDSEVASKEVVNNFDAEKKFIAWVYTKGYGSASYAFATDPMVIELQKTYNVVEVNNATDVAPSADLANADLIVCTEAMTGNKNLSNGMKNFVGTTPMIGLKAFNYTKGRWSWGTPSNPSPARKSFTPKSVSYNLLDGVVFESDGTIKLATAESGNVIQTVEFGTTDCTAPEGNTILGTLDGNDAKAVMYTSTKYFGLGLSSDCWATYTNNAITIVKNAAALLIAGEDLTAEGTPNTSIVATITTADYATFVPVQKVAVPDGVEAYIVKAITEKAAIFEPVSVIPANTPVIIYQNVEADTEVTFEPSNAEADDVTLNKLEYSDEAIAANGQYILANGEDGVGFYKAATGTIAARKAYLPASANANFLSFSFDGDATGIEKVENAAVNANGTMFNLAGQRVAQPTKGLYIVNGKKVVVK